jgi:hypothetical protein
MPISHKAVLEGTRDVWRQFGEAMLSVAAVMLVFALIAFVFRTWILLSWPQTSGTVVDSVLIMKRSGDGTLGCAAVESVQYYVNGRSLTVKYRGHALTNDCASMEATLDAVRGQHRRIVYNKRLPEATYSNPGVNADFYRDALLLGRIALLTGIMGFAAIQRHRSKVNRAQVADNLPEAYGPQNAQ